jgi:HK97 family phage portal protein
MGVSTRLKAAWGALRSEPARSTAPAAADGLSDPTGTTVANLLGFASGSRWGGGEKDALSIPATLRALEILTGTFAMTPLIYYRKTADGGKERADDQPESVLFRERPNDVQSPFLFKELMLGDLLMRGRFAAYVHRDGMYRPGGLSRLLPTAVQPAQYWSKADGTELFYDATLPDGSAERLTRDSCWYVPGFSRDGLLGVERLKLCADTFEAASATSHFARRFWENNAQPSTILTTKQKVDPEDKNKIKADWQSRFGGPRNAGGVAVLDQELKAEFLAHDNKQAQYIETRTFYVLELARCWGIPPHLIFELSKATFGNIEQQSLEFIVFHMMPHYERVASAATHYFARPGHFYEFLPDALLKGDILSRYQAYGIAIDKGWLNPNDVLARENMNKRPGGEQYRMGSGSMLEGQSPASPPVPKE